ncbi:methyltransferase LaeA, partial [Aureobasidium melanogenum]
MQQEWYEENGRWYHAWQKGLYMYPHDEEERHRMDVYHNLFYDKAGLSLHSARLIPEVAHRPRIMDLGCGTGFWAIDMGEQYPEGEVLGLDLANLQPAQIPPNVRFQIPFNFETPYWSLGQDSWDLIHMQMLCGSVSSWPNLYAKVFS